MKISNLEYKVEQYQSDLHIWGSFIQELHVCPVYFQIYQPYPENTLLSQGILNSKSRKPLQLFAISHS